MAEKAKILDLHDKRDKVPDTWTRGAVEPMFWQESKPGGMFCQLFKDLKVKAVFDFTPGSGACASAAMVEGILYHGLCLGPSHCHPHGCGCSQLGPDSKQFC